MKILFTFLSLIFLLNANAQWVQKGLDIDGQSVSDQCGAVSMPDENTLAVGSIGHDGNGTDAGNVRVYEWNGSAWIQKGSDINGEAAGDASGWSVSMPDANTVAIGAIGNDDNGNSAGQVRVYEWNGSAWVQKGLDIDGEAPDDSFGWNLSMPNANTIAVGAPYNDGNGGASGHVRVYEWNGSAWVQKGLDIDGEAGADRSGWSVSMPDANSCAIGATLNDGNGNSSGHVRIYAWNGSAWIQKGLDIDGEAASDQSGGSVSMPDANTVGIGATVNGPFAGHARVYEWNGSAWIQKGLDMDGEASGDQAGYSVSMPNSNTIAIGANLNDGNGSSAGQVRVFEWNGTAWIQKDIDIDGEAANDESGTIVSMPGSNTVAIGAKLNDGNGADAGHVRVYQFVLAPIACFTPTPNPVECNQTVAFDGTCSYHEDGAKTIDAYEWDFDNDGTTDATGSNASNTFTSTGTFTVELKVTDNVGDQDSTTLVITVNDNTDPIAICQDINLYLDGTGNATLNPASLDNGSSDACGILSFSASQTAFDCSDLIAAPANDLIITGIIDGPLTGGLPKAIEVYVVNNIADMSQYGFGSANNGMGSDGEEFTFPAGTATAGTHLYVSLEATEFTNFFGFAPDYTTFAANINGDDAIELFYQSNVIDVFGDINLAGNGQPWDYMDGWAYRNNNTGNDGSAFILGNWSFSGINALDGETTNGAAASPLPVGTFSYSVGPGPVLVNLTVNDGNGNSANCVSNVTVIDTISPVVDVLTLAPINDVCSAAMPTAPTATDNCSGSLIGVPDVTFPITTQGTTTVTWTYTDASGNTKTQTQDVILSDGVNPTASNPTPVIVECTADIPIPDITAVTDELDNCTAAPIVAHVSDVSDGNTCPEVITRTYSVSDDAGNQIMVTQLITVSDVTSPAADVATLSAISAECQSTPTAPTATDNCDGALTAIPDVTFPITTLGTTTVTWTYTDACGNATQQTQDVIITDIDNSVTVSGVTITAAASGYQYQWVDCDNSNAPIAGQTAQSFTPTANGNYAVQITDGTCTVTSACEAITSVGVLENGFATAVSVYPNPTDGEVKISLGALYKNITVQVKSITGQLIQTETYVSAENIELNINGADGLYVINIQSENGQSAVLRVMKTH